MKHAIVTCSCATMTLFAALAAPIRLAAQYHHYHVVDLGTLGGPNSFIPFAGTKTTNNRGDVIVEADTAVPDPYAPYCFQPLYGACQVNHALLWRDGSPIDLGALSGVNSSFPDWVNSRGSVVGFSENGLIDPLTGAPAEVGVLWQDGQIIDLGTLGGSGSAPVQINDRGEIAGGAMNASPDPYSATFPQAYCGANPCFMVSFPWFQFGAATQIHAVLWHGGVIHDLGTLGGPDSVAWFVNDRGEIAGQSYINSIPNPTTGVPTIDPFFIGEDGKMRDIPNGFGGTASYLAGFNNRGQLAGTFTLTGDLTDHPFLWDRGVLTDLGTFGSDCGEANAINDAGQVVGWACSPTAIFAFRWQNGVLTNLGTVNGDACSVGNAMNSRGDVVGESSPSCFNVNLGPEEAFVWEGDGPAVDLNRLVQPGTGLKLEGGFSINDRGEIAGDSYINGDHHAFFAVPCDENHPGIEGCDYSLVDVTAHNDLAPVARRPSSVPAVPATPRRGMVGRIRNQRFPSFQ
jgi:probable HAF family extracellular repeat protein